MPVIEETPLMRQYKNIKKDYEDAVLFFRLGDFYEMFFEDAKIVSKELGITLTSRNKEKGIQVPLAGVPYHSAAQYISKLISKGYKVAICEQVEDPKASKGIVKREVVKVITPGTVADVDSMDGKTNNYLLSYFLDKLGAGIAYMDITTGEFNTVEFTGEDFLEKSLNQVFRIGANEIIVNSIAMNSLEKRLKEYCSLNEILLNEGENLGGHEEYLKDYFNVISLESYGIAEKEHSIKACAIVLNYVLDLQKNGEIPINKIKYLNLNRYMELNITTQKNLELIQSEKNKSDIGTLLWVLDSTKTSMGARYLKSVIKNPLIDLIEIEKRNNHVEYFIDEIIIREELREKLKNIYDLERLIAKIILGTENGRDLNAIKKSLIAITEIYDVLENGEFLSIDKEKILKLYNLIDNAILDDAPFSIREGNIIKRFYNEELDELHDISKSGKDYLLKLEQREKERTGIKTLKVKYNKIFGYFLEVTNNNINLVPDDYIRKQTLANAERYITPELKEYENKILNAKDKINEIEYKLFKKLSNEVKKEKKDLQELADSIAYLDMIISFSHVAIKNNYIKPIMKENYELDIVNGRHPIVEKLIGEQDYISNSIKLTEEERIAILTGPNMAGKSTYMKQVALIILMAQIGSFVPADYACIGLTDKIFTRVGASDDLLSGQSTFMVEMSEVASIVNTATERSFIILDEVGRGTSTFDGISIAWAITEYLSKKIKAKTIFATHYHELTELENRLENVVNFRVEVKETSDEVVFLRQIVRGGADKSYGIEVAKLAGLPEEILTRSKKILKDMEKKRDIVEKKIMATQLSLFKDIRGNIEEKNSNENILDQLKAVEINNITPIQALNKLNELKKLLKNGG